ncbi:MAG: response regulator transcription factor [Bacteroidetes bacterium]|nr:response regulator transcription factor [Bacteroidota bacterium]
MAVKKIQAAIIEDESRSLAMLRNLLRDYAPQVEVAGTAQSVEEGIKLMNAIKPDLLFLDIAMPDGDGFQVLEKCDQTGFEIIFTTAYEEYAVRAFDFSAMNYLLKPISSEDLLRVLDQFKRIHPIEKKDQQIGILKQSLYERFERIALPTIEGLEFLQVDKILRCEADGSYTIFHMLDGHQVIVSKSLNHYEKLLQNTLFYRIHHKHLVNLRYILKYMKGSGGYVILQNGESVDVSVRRKEGFLKAVKEGLV